MITILVHFGIGIIRCIVFIGVRIRADVSIGYNDIVTIVTVVYNGIVKMIILGYSDNINNKSGI